MEYTMDYSWYNMKNNKVKSLVNTHDVPWGSMVSSIVGRNMKGICPSLTLLVSGLGLGGKWMSILGVKVFLQIKFDIKISRFYTGVEIYPSVNFYTPV